MDPAWERFCSGYDERVRIVTDRLILITTRPNSKSRDKEIELLMQEWGQLKAKMMLAEMIRGKKVAPA
jgi:hypothetical protein